MSAEPTGLTVPAFSINFHRRRMLSVGARRALLYVMLGYLALNVVVAGSLMVMAQHTRGQRKQIEHVVSAGAVAEGASPDVIRQMQALETNATTQLKSLTTAVALQRARWPLGGKLAALTRTLPHRTWITTLSADREHRKLTINARYFVDPANPYDYPAKAWLEALRADPSFRVGLKQLDLGSSSTQNQGNAQVYVFQVNGEWNAP